MKANELMIGDWVKFIQSDGQGFYAQVEALNDDGTFAESGFFADNMVRPIPLTAEILEKNGYNYNVGSGGLFQINIKGLNCHISFNIIHYVHELQHALRLCGIEKEIEL